MQIPTRVLRRTIPVLSCTVDPPQRRRACKGAGFGTLGRLWATVGLHFGVPGATFHDFFPTSIFHRFWDGFFIDFPSFLDVKLAPLPNLANLLNWNKYRTRALFYYPRELRFFMIFLSFSVSDFIPNSIYFWTSFFITFAAQR
mgnify:CR=1 FL=1